MTLLEDVSDPRTRLSLTETSGCHVHFSQFAEDCVLWDLLQLHNLLDGGFMLTWVLIIPQSIPILICCARSSTGAE